jgi:hypothetical protein
MQLAGNTPIRGANNKQTQEINFLLPGNRKWKKKCTTPAKLVVQSSLLKSSVDLALRLRPQAASAAFNQ